MAEEGLAKELADYAGRWVAVKDRAVVASAGSLEDLLACVDLQRLDRILEVAAEPVARLY